ncbi:MAG: prephenate dehydrogenase [Bacteroidetes bacterium]|nr:prephenate dehydrogenase [Bacteroidota bacterium]
MKVGIIGLGLIGGSVAISLRKRSFADYFYGFDINSDHGAEAKQIGFIDEYVDLDTLISKSDLIVVAIPVDKARKLIASILDKIGDKQIVADMGSTKSGVCEEVKNHPNRKHFVATHPIAGTENSGPSAAIDNLFDTKITIICDKELSDPTAVSVIEKMYECLKMRIIYMNSEEHDRHIAYVSHLSHITSFMLGKTVLEIEKDEKSIFNMAGSGFESTVRLAKSSPAMWAPILEQNKKHLSVALDAYIKNLNEFKKFIEEGDTYSTYKMMSEVNEIRRVLKGIKPVENK